MSDLDSLQAPCNAASDWSVEEYFADKEHLSSSAINSMIRKGSRYYYERYIAGSIKEQDSTAFAIGRALHCYLLEPQHFKSRFVVAPICDKRTKEGKKAWSDFKASIGWEEGSDAKVTFMTDEQIDLIESMAKSIMYHEYASSLLTADVERIKETPIRYEYRRRKCKALPDIVLPNSDLIVDLKTTTGLDASPVAPTEFRRTMERFGYHRQAQWYRMAYQAKYGRVPNFAFVVVDTKEPHDVAVYILRDSLLDIARKEIDEVLDDIESREAIQVWVPEYSKGAIELGSSKYYVPYRKDNRINDE